MHITYFGYPAKVGGASTECLHTVRLWRECGWDVTLIPTWNEPSSEDRAPLDALGAKTLCVKADELESVPGLAGSTVVSMCNDRFLNVAGFLRERMGCKIIWLNCMTFLNDHERSFFHLYGTPEAMIYQSDFQRSQLDKDIIPQYGHNPDRSFRVRGAFSWREWPFHPLSHTPGELFTFGRCARQDLDKWFDLTYDVFRLIKYRPLSALLMGVGPMTEKHLGLAPEWVKTFPPNAMPVCEFYDQLHCCLPLNGEACENWPRVGLECFAHGVPLVAPNRWGWREMVINGETGLLGNTFQELAAHVERLATNEPLRRHLIANARTHLEQTLANPAEISAAWERVFAYVSSHPQVRRPEGFQTGPRAY
jgi:hypothetical protein